MQSARCRDRCSKRQTCRSKSGQAHREGEPINERAEQPDDPAHDGDAVLARAAAWRLQALADPQETHGGTI